MHVKHTVRDLRVRVSVRVRNDFSNLTLTLIKPRTPRHKFANLSIVLVLSEAQPSGPRPRIDAYFEDEGRRVRSWKYLSLIAMGRTVPVSRDYDDCTQSQMRPEVVQQANNS